MSKIVCVIPTIRKQRYEEFCHAWDSLFKKYNISLVTVWDGEEPTIEYTDSNNHHHFDPFNTNPWQYNKDLFYNFTDSCRNIGFILAAQLGADYILTLDDDVKPVVSIYGDSISKHLEVFEKQADITWTPTFYYKAPNNKIYFPRGVPYKHQNSSPIMLSHGVWQGVQDYDGETQRELEEKGYPLGSGTLACGTIPRGTFFPLCGMNVMVKREALPYLYYAPMGPKTGLDLHRFGDIWMGIFLKKRFDYLNWACYSGSSIVVHDRASDSQKNYEQEKLGRKWNECDFTGEHPIYTYDDHQQREFYEYFRKYAEKRDRYARLVRDTYKLQGSVL